MAAESFPPKHWVPSSAFYRGDHPPCDGRQWVGVTHIRAYEAAGSRCKELEQERDDAKGDALHAALRCKESESALEEIADAERAQDADPLEWATWAHDLARKAIQGKEAGE